MRVAGLQSTLAATSTPMMRRGMEQYDKEFCFEEMSATGRFSIMKHRKIVELLIAGHLGGCISICFRRITTQPGRIPSTTPGAKYGNFLETGSWGVYSQCQTETVLMAQLDKKKRRNPTKIPGGTDLTAASPGTKHTRAKAYDRSAILV